MRRFFEIGGVVAGVALIAFGVAATYMGVDGRSTVRDSIRQEQIVFGSADDPAVSKHASEWAEEQVETGTQGGAFAQVIREHALEASGGLTDAQMGRFVSADDPENPAGTSDEAAALKDEEGNPVPNAARNTWVTATALSTALNMSYMAERLAIFGIVVGVALLLAGIGSSSSLSASSDAMNGRGWPGGGPFAARQQPRKLGLVPPRARGRLRPPSSLPEGGEAAVLPAIDVDDVRRRLAAGTGGYEIVHTSAGLELGVYVLVAPEADRQQPHEDDEVDMVLEGRGTLEVEGEAVHLSEGQAAFVPAGAEHRFVGYESLSVLVIFARASPPG